jgi:hypothetical protein
VIAKDKVKINMTEFNGWQPVSRVQRQPTKLAPAREFFRPASVLLTIRVLANKFGCHPTFLLFF